MLNFLLTQVVISKPQQLSTYALTLFNYETKIDGNEVSVGE